MVMLIVLAGICLIATIAACHQAVVEERRKGEEMLKKAETAAEYRLEETLKKERETFGAAFAAADEWYRGKITELSSELRKERAKGRRLWN